MRESATLPTSTENLEGHRSEAKIARQKRQRAKISAPGFVRQQIGYVALFSSWLSGMLFAPELDMLPIALSMILVAIFFLMHEPIALLENAFRTHHDYRKRWQPYVWLGVLSVCFFAAGIPLIAQRPAILWLLIPAAILLGLYLVLRRYGVHKLGLSLIGLAALSVAAPIARLAAAPQHTWQELTGAWILSAAFFSLSIMTLYIRQTGESAVKPTLYYTGVLLGVLMVLVALQMLPYIAMVMVLLQVVKLGWIATRIEEYRKWPIASANMLETCMALGFLSLCIFA